MKCHVGYRHARGQPAHVAHVLRIDMFMRVMRTVLHAMNDGAGSQKQQCLEERMRHQMKRCRNISADAQGGNHETELADCGKAAGYSFLH